jgi:phosphoserine phosphatase RsbU/P
MQSIVPSAGDPQAVLRGLNRIVTGQPHDQFVTAAYLWLDTENRRALYSAAGHPPLLLWREGKLERVESNGIVFGATQQPDYPVCEMGVCSGDRFILYTDGVIEVENGRGEFFGDRMLEEAIRRNESRSPAQLVEQLLSALRNWQPSSTAQQDDITLIVEEKPKITDSTTNQRAGLPRLPRRGLGLEREAGGELEDARAAAT